MKLAFRTGVNIFVSYFAMVLCINVIGANDFLINIIGLFTLPVVALIIFHIFNVLLDKVPYLKLLMDEKLKSIKLGILLLELYFIGRGLIIVYSIFDDGIVFAFVCTIMLVLNFPLSSIIKRYKGTS